MAYEIEARKHTVAEVFSDAYDFVMPVFQRPYSWKRQHVESLLDDLIYFQETAGDPNTPYFVGSLVVAKQPDSTLARVVDGQQRLTTLTIMLSVMRHLLPESVGNKLTKYLYAEGDPFVKKDDRFRLTLRDADKDFFCEHIQRPGGIEKLLTKAAEHLTTPRASIQENTRYLVEKLHDMPQEKLLELAQTIVGRCQLVMVATHDDDSAYRIFSILNDRGMALSPADIIKADVFQQIPESTRAAYVDRWEDIEEDLEESLEGRNELGALLSLIRSARCHDKSTNLLSELRQVVASVGAKRFIEDILSPYAEAYLVVRCKEFPHDHPQREELESWLHWLALLRDIDSPDWLPAAVHFLANEPTASDRIVPFFEKLERLAAYQAIMASSPKDRRERYGRLLAELDAGLGDKATALEIDGAERKRWLSRLDANNAYKKINSKRLRYIMRRIDAYLANEEVKWSHKTVTVEHVLPQKPKAGSQWLQDFPDANKRQELVHCLGNLVLLNRSKNSSMGNYEFDAKKKKYFLKQRGKGKGISTFAVTTEVINEPEWTPSTINARRRRLISILKDIWKLG